MNAHVRTLIVGLGSLLATAATAQDADRDASSSSTGARSSTPTAPAYTVHNNGSSKAILVPFGPFITQAGVGGGGANVSELYTTFTLGAAGYNIFGYGMQGSLNIHVADDFTVPATQSWTVQSVKWLSYQTGSATTGSITSMNLNLWSSSPNGQLQGGQTTTGGNQFQSNSWTGVYRVTDNGPGLTAITRPIIQVTCGGAWVPALTPGTFWLEAYAGGTLASGPWSPPKTRAGQVPPTGDPWNGLQSTSAGAAFVQVYDTGNPAGSINEPGDFLWQIEGTAATCSCMICPSKTSSLGCAPTMTTNLPTASKSGTGLTQLTATPVPGGPGLTGILIYSKNAPIAPIATSFGSLCLSAFARAGAFATTPGGTSGTCSGAYVWNATAIASGTASILVGDVLRLQGWYRDPGFPPPGNANFTNVVDGIAIVP
jgi:hypothetical protein